MILLRVAENLVRQYYTKITSKDAKEAHWNEMLRELSEQLAVKKPLIGLLDYLRDKRNEAQHPDKRFGQSEAEQILLNVKAVLDELAA
jgi:hypothetical protein